jgi:hypothetical protein
VRRFLCALSMFVLLTGCNNGLSDRSKEISYQIINRETINQWNKENKPPGEWFFDTLWKMSKEEQFEGIEKMNDNKNTYILVFAHMEASAKIHVKQIYEENEVITVVIDTTYSNGKWGGGIGYEGLLLKIEQTDKEVNLTWSNDD